MCVDCSSIMLSSTLHGVISQRLEPLEFKPTLFVGHWIQVSGDDPAGEEPRVTTGKEIRWAHSLSGGRDTLNLFS